VGDSERNNLDGLAGNDGKDILRGDVEPNVITGMDRIDPIYGGGGNDTLYGYDRGNPPMGDYINGEREKTSASPSTKCRASESDPTATTAVR
jgi:hypothetical protein